MLQQPEQEKVHGRHIAFWYLLWSITGTCHQLIELAFEIIGLNKPPLDVVRAIHDMIIGPLDQTMSCTWHMVLNHDSFLPSESCEITHGHKQLTFKADMAGLLYPMNEVIAQLGPIWLSRDIGRRSRWNGHDFDGKHFVNVWQFLCAPEQNKVGSSIGFGISRHIQELCIEDCNPEDPTFPRCVHSACSFVICVPCSFCVVCGVLSCVCCCRHYNEPWLRRPRAWSASIKFRTHGARQEQGIFLYTASDLWRYNGHELRGARPEVYVVLDPVNRTISVDRVAVWIKVIVSQYYEECWVKIGPSDPVLVDRNRTYDGFRNLFKPRQLTFRGKYMKYVRIVQSRMNTEYTGREEAKAWWPKAEPEPPVEECKWPLEPVGEAESAPNSPQTTVHEMLNVQGSLDEEMHE